MKSASTSGELMDAEALRKLWLEQLITLRAAAQVLRESYDRVSSFLLKPLSSPLSIEQRESCEALTARHARLFDFIFQKAFRTLDRIELQDALLATPELFETVSRIENYSKLKGYS